MSTTSLVDKLKELNQPSDVTSRANLAVTHGLVKTPQEYLSSASAGTNADINLSLLSKISQTAPPATPPATPPAETSTPPSTSTSTTPPVPASTGASNTNIASTSSINSTTPTVSNAPLTGSQLATYATAPNPSTFVQANTGNTLADMVSKVAKENIVQPNQLAIDTLKSQLEAKTAEAKTTETGKVSGFEQTLQNIIGSTSAQDALKSAVETFKIKENLQLYNDIQTRVVEAQKALEMGMIYEADRPARMSFITGSSSTLQKQGLATIGALQGTAAVIKGNIELAKTFADATVNAINSDNERSFKALTTLLDLHNSKLVTLTADEKNMIADRITSIEKSAEEIQKNKNDVISYMTTYPQAFLKGGVTLLDSREKALEKMLPFLSAEQAAKEKADLDFKNSQTIKNLAEAGKIKLESGKGDNSLTNVVGPDGKTKLTLGQVKDQIVQLKSAGATYLEIINTYGADVPITYIDELYGKSKSSTITQNIQESYYSQMVDTQGNPKPGYKFSGKIDAKGNPEIVPDTSGKSHFWSSVGEGIGSIFK